MMTDFDYPYESEDDEDGNGWNWYYVTMWDMETGAEVHKPWPVFAEGFDAAMEIYYLLAKETAE